MKPQTEYVVSETRWLLSFGRPPLEIARQVHRTPNTLYHIALRHNLPDIKQAFAAYSNGHKK